MSSLLEGSVLKCSVAVLSLEQPFQKIMQPHILLKSLKHQAKYYQRMENSLQHKML